MLDNNQKTNIRFNSTSGIIVKTHPKSKISYCEFGSRLYNGTPEELILQVMLINEKRIIMEYLSSKEDLDDIFTKENNNE